MEEMNGQSDPVLSSYDKVPWRVNSDYCRVYVQSSGKFTVDVMQNYHELADRNVYEICPCCYEQKKDIFLR